MTTPAVNEYSQLSHTVSTKTEWVHNGKVENSATTSFVTQYGVHARVRPASSTVPINNGWRGCKPWSHKGRDWQVKGTPVRRIVHSGYYDVTDTYDGDGNFWFFKDPGWPELPSSSVINRAEVEALNNLKDQQFHLGVFLAESKRTIALVGDTMSSIARSVRIFKNRHRELWKLVKRYQLGGHSRKTLDRIPGKWLEVQYGWIPLMSDVVGAMEHLLREDRGPLIHADGRYTDHDTREIRLDTGFAGVYSYCEIKQQFTAWVSLWYELNLPELVELSQLGLINPTEICWELLPYSFVVDWFIPVGTWLSALTADQGFTFKGGSLSRMTREVGGRTTDVSVPSGSTEILGARGRLEGESFSFERTCYSASPVPGLYVKNPLSLMHVLNGSALLYQAFR